MKPNLTLVGDWATTCRDIKFEHGTERLIMNFEGSKKILGNKYLKKAGPILENSDFPKLKKLYIEFS